MEQLPKGYTLELCEGAFPLSTDSVVLANFTKLPKNARVLDLGSGCGTLGMLLCAKDESCTVTGMELSQAAHDMALQNIRRNGLDSRLTSICGDLRDMPANFTTGTFHVCVSNPPYFSGGPASSATPLARRDDCCNPRQLMAAASWALNYGGDFFLVHKPEKLAQLIACAAAYQLEAKKLLLLRHRENGPISLILLQLRKGGKPGLIITENSLFDSRDQPTALFREAYHIP